jgi:hypothetical protein
MYEEGGEKENQPLMITKDIKHLMLLLFIVAPALCLTLTTLSSGPDLSPLYYRPVPTDVFSQPHYRHKDEFAARRLPNGNAALRR